MKRKWIDLEKPLKAVLRNPFAEPDSSYRCHLQS